MRQWGLSCGELLALRAPTLWHAFVGFCTPHDRKPLNQGWESVGKSLELSAVLPLKVLGRSHSETALNPGK